MLLEADKKRYVVTCDVDSTNRSNNDTIKDFGLCDFHSYTLIKVKAVETKPKSKKYKYLL
jgi:hypothetical protein